MYTHKISWTEFDQKLGFHVPKDFRTTEDAVRLHLSSLLKRNINNLKVELIRGN